MIVPAPPSFTNVPVILPEYARGGVLGQKFLHLEDFGVSREHWLDVPLDYTERLSNATLRIRYHTNDQYWDQDNGPIFLTMGGEGTVNEARCSMQAMSHKALCVSVEHRFYGLSMPQGGSTIDNLKAGLYTEYNLADTARVIEELWKEHGQRDVVNFGGSYSGATCAWFRSAFPDHTSGCISESGVVNPILEFVDFDRDINEASGIPDAQCADNLREATRAMERLASRNFDDLKRLFHADNLIGTTMGDTDFWYMVADGPAMLVQYGSKLELCSGLSKLGDAPTDEERASNLAEIIIHHYGSKFGGECFYDSDCIKLAVPPEGRSGLGGLTNDRSWRFQKCGELAYLQAAPKNDLRVRSAALTEQVLLDQCAYAFEGVTPTEKNKQWLDITGGAHIMNGTGFINAPSNILFINYSDDPWKYAGILESPSESLPSCYLECNGCGHCGAGAPLGNRCAKQAENLVSKWLNEARRQ